jgi:hypothetical protein
MQNRLRRCAASKSRKKSRINEGIRSKLWGIKICRYAQKDADDGVKHLETAEIKI